MEAKYFTREASGSVRCSLCPHLCVIRKGNSGKCGIRYNNGEILEATGFGLVSALALDPVEKKPLYHFYPGTKILSVGGFGCNFTCNFCQNHEISQHTASDLSRRLDPGELVKRACETADNIGLAFTYNEPVISFEYIVATAALARTEGLKVVMVSNAYIASEPLAELLAYTDAWNIDLKGFTEEFYRRNCGGSLLPVLSAISQVKKAKQHLELSCLVIPGKNDGEREMTEMFKWIASNTGKDTVLHLLRYFPRYRLETPPTPVEDIIRLRELARVYLDNVYTGNMSDQEGSGSYCPACSTVYITRVNYQVSTRLTTNQCPECGHLLYGRF